MGVTCVLVTVASVSPAAGNIHSAGTIVYLNTVALTFSPVDLSAITVTSKNHLYSEQEVSLHHSVLTMFEAGLIRSADPGH